MPQNPNQTPTTVKTYSAPDKWLKGVLGLSASLTVYFVLLGWRVWPAYQRFGLTPRMRFYLIWLAVLMVFLVVIGFRGYQRRKWRFEVGPEGVALLEGDGTRRLIRWDQMGEIKEDMSGGNLTITDKDGRNRFLITRLYTGFDELKRSVYAGWQRDPERVSPVSGGESQVFVPSKSLKTMCWAGGSLFLVMGLACAVCLVCVFCGFIQPSHAPLFVPIVLTFGFIFFTAFAVYYLFVALKNAQDKIELSSQGIARLRGDGSRLFIKWGDIGRLTKRERMKQLGVYDRYGTQMIMVDYQFERFDQIKDRILEECQKYFQAPLLPVTYGRLPVLPNLGLLGFFSAFIALMLWIEFTQKTTGGPGGFVLCLLIFVGVYLAALFSEAKLVKALTLEGEGIILHRLLNKTALAWEDIGNVEVSSASTHGGRYIFVKITTLAGKEFSLSWVIGNQLEAYIAMKKMLERKIKS